MAIESERQEVNYVSGAIVGVAGSYSTTENIKGIVKKIAIVSGTMLSGIVAITDTHTAENVWNEDPVDCSGSTHPVKYPRISGNLTAGTAISDHGADEIGFPTDNITISLTGITPATGTATYYIYFQ